MYPVTFHQYLCDFTAELCSVNGFFLLSSISGPVFLQFQISTFVKFKYSQLFSAQLWLLLEKPKLGRIHTAGSSWLVKLKLSSEGRFGMLHLGSKTWTRRPAESDKSSEPSVAGRQFAARSDKKNRLKRKKLTRKTWKLTQKQIILHFAAFMSE